MILSKDINPKHSLYFTGSLIIDRLLTSENKNFDFLELYHNLQNNQKITMNIFTLSLDWLFLNDVIRINNGKIEKCF